MIKKNIIIFFVVLAFVSLSHQIDINALLEKMTNEDKCGQMTQITFDVIMKEPSPADPYENPVDESKLMNAIINKKVGSILNTPYNTAQHTKTWQSIISIIQDYAQKTDLKIPVIYGLDSIHGANYIRESTLFPQPLGMASSFNLDIASKVGEITSFETRATGIPWNFNPVLDVGRQPVWPRLYETYGEDAYVATHMGSAYIKGHQGDLTNRSLACTCLKHYIGYSMPFDGRDRTVAWIPEILLREQFLPSFAAGVKAGSPTVMINSGDVNGIPGHANSHYINDILKGELKFEGFTVSDWVDIIRLHERDKVADSPEEAVRLSVMAGLDMSMVPYDFSFFDHCVNLTKKNPAFLNRVNDATTRILKVKDQLGLFDNSYPNPASVDKVGIQSSEDFNLEAASESIILAKNEKNTLPLLDKSKKILVTGPTSNLIKVLNGGWSYSWQGEWEDNFNNYGRKKLTMFGAISAKATSVEFRQGANFDQIANDFDDTIQTASNSDIIILCIGEETYTETPGNINNLRLPDAQYQLANALANLNKQLIVVYLGGRPRIMTDIADKASAVLVAFLPGNRGAEAIANILFGEYVPNGKFPVTYPKSSNGISTYDHKVMEEKDGNFYEYLFPFGHGLSYTTFQYSDLALSSSVISTNQNLRVSVKVKNTGNYDGKETVLLYLNDEYASVSRPARQIRGFKKIFLKKGEEQTVTFDLENYDLSFINEKLERVVEDGYFNVYVADMEKRFQFVNQATTTSKSVTTSKNSGSIMNKSLIIILGSALLSFLHNL